MTSKLFQKIEDSIPRMHGWCDVPKAITLASMILALRPKIVVELGVWGGRSLLPMAAACKEASCGFVYAVDPWKPESSIIGQTQEHSDWWLKADHEEVYQSYLKFISSAGVGAFVKTLRMTSNEALSKLNGMAIDIIHCDGNHGDQAYQDAVNYSPLVRRGGLWVADDLSWEGGYVARGIDHLLKNGFIELYPLGTGAVYQRL
jgi:predicted O-methyltransferase YrrM